MGETNNGLKWGSNASFLLATLGAALGIGKFWRFPYEILSFLCRFLAINNNLFI